MKYIVMLFVLLVLGGCGPTKHPTDPTKTKDACRPTDMFIYANSIGWRRVWDCGDHE